MPFIHALLHLAVLCKVVSSTPMSALPALHLPAVQETVLVRSCVHLTSTALAWDTSVQSAKA